MITVVNYGLGNINAFVNVYKRLNIPVIVANQKEDLHDTQKIILPGVGAFDQAMGLLNKSGMREYLDELVLEKKIPVLGICVGMQILGNSSEEGQLPGLGWIPGEVKKFDVSFIKHKTQLPHMGWNTVNSIKCNAILKDLHKHERFYFLHSYYFKCNNRDNEIAETEYGNSFTSAVNNHNIFGVQFHPEKSHENGIQLLHNFAKI